MNERARRRALRNFVASILMSNLTKSEIYEIAEGIVYGDLGRELGEMLRDASMLVRELPSERYALELTPSNDPVRIASEIVQRKRMTKRALAQLMTTVAPRLMKDEVPSGSVRQIIEWFFAVAPPNQEARLLSLLSGEAQDPYLKGIVRRS